MWTPPRELPNLSAARELIVDLETNDEGLRDEIGAGWPWRGGYVVGIGVGTLDRSWYFPIRHAGGGNVDPEAVLRWARDTFAVERRYVFHNALYDLGWSRTDGIKFAGEIHDTNAGAALLDEQRLGYDLDSCARDAGHAGKDTGALVDAYRRLPDAAPLKNDWTRAARANLWRLHSKDVGEYAEGDIDATRALWLWQAPRIEADGLADLYRLECDLLPMLTEMRARGIRIDVGAAERLWDQVRATEALAQKRLKWEFGATITGPRQAGQIAKVCDRLGIAYPLTPKTKKASFSKEWMAKHPHPFFVAFNTWRQLNTTRTLCIEGGILEHLHGDRIHPELSPLRRDNDNGGTVTGRFSCSKPNTQQASERSALGQAVRALYLPEDGALWNAADVSQQEPRLIVHYAVLCRLPKALEAARAFEKEGADWHQIVADMVGITRKNAKPINLGLGYGMGNKKLAASLGLSLADALDIINRYHARLPFVRGLAELCDEKAKARGYITTLGGRRRRFPFYEPDVRPRPGAAPVKAVRGLDCAKAEWPDAVLRRAYTRLAMNSLIQGSAADWIKRAMLALWRAGIVPMLQVHDEIDTSIAVPEESARIAEIVREAVTLRCPVVVNSGTGANWRDAKL